MTTTLIFLAALAPAALVLLGAAWRNGGDLPTMDEDEVQNDFGLSMDRFGYVQEARNGGGE